MKFAIKLAIIYRAIDVYAQSSLNVALWSTSCEYTLQVLKGHKQPEPSLRHWMSQKSKYDVAYYLFQKQKFNNIVAISEV